MATTYPRRHALERADILGWEEDRSTTPRRPGAVAHVVHHRTKRGADVCSNPTGGSYSDHWWLHTDDGELIDLLGSDMQAVKV